jgi:hypothetical protein
MGSASRDTWVKHGLNDIDDHVEDDKESGKYEDGSLQQRQISLKNSRVQ